MLLQNIKKLLCAKCGRSVSGIETFDGVDFIENGKSFHDKNANNFVMKGIKEIYKQSEVVHSTNLEPDPSFQHSNLYSSPDTHVTSICKACNKYYDLHQDGSVASHFEFEDSQSQSQTECMSSPNFHSQENYPQGKEKKKTTVDINPWGAEHLFTLNLFSEEEYACFMRSLTKAELMVISPLHINIQVIRCRATQIPFSKHGSIAYPLKSPMETKELPWIDFHNLPFIVVYNEGYNPKNNYEAKINLQNIVRARKLMEVKLDHPLFEGGRTRYRFIGLGFCTFSNTQMAKLQEELDIENNNCHVLPHGLRQHEICEYREKLNHNVPKAQVENWLNSHYPLADAVYTGCVSGKFHDFIDNNNKLIFEQFCSCLKKFIMQYLNTKINENSKAQADIYKR